MYRLGFGAVTALLVLGVIFFAGISVGGSNGTKLAPVSLNMSEIKLADETTYVKAQVSAIVEGVESHLYGTLNTRRTLVAVADCRFGIDYKKYPFNGYRSGDSITVTVVEPYNLGCEPSLAKSRFLDGGGLLPASVDLLNSLGVKASDEISKEAVKLGYAEQAKESARLSLEALFQKAGMKTVKVVFIKP